MLEDLDILFVNPGDRKQIYQQLGDEFCAVEPPVFAGLFASHAIGKGLRVGVLDVPAENIDAEEVARRIEETARPALVVIVVYGVQPSASTQNMTSAGNIAAQIKARNPGRHVLMTGTHPAALPERTLREEQVDFVVQGEGPATCVDVFRALTEGATDFSAIPSLWWKDSEGQPHRPARTADLIRDLDAEVPGVAWNLLDMKRYRAHNWHCFDHIDARTPYAAIHTSLGCPYRCTFCCINAPFGKPSYRMWSPDRVVAEIDFLVEHHGVRNIKFVDEMFVLNRRHVLGICDRLNARGHDLNIWAYARVDTVQDDFLARLRGAGFRWLCLGIEAANSRVRDGSLKAFDDESIIDTCKRIRAHGIHVIANYIFGLPRDTLRSMQETLALATEINSEFANFYCAMPYPGAPLYDLAVREGRPLPQRWHHYSQHSYDTLPLANEALDAAEILRFRDESFQTYFRRPEYVASMRREFGTKVVEHIARMCAVPLPRRLLESTPSAA